MLKTGTLSNLYERFFTDRGEEVSIQSLNQATIPPTYQETLSARAVVVGYTAQELLSGAIPENSIKLLILSEDLDGYQIKLKQDRILIRDVSYVPQSVNNLVRSSSGVTYAIEVRCIS